MLLEIAFKIVVIIQHKRLQQEGLDHEPQEMLWLVLEKFGVPMKSLKFKHANVLVKFTVNNVTNTIDYIIGLKQTRNSQKYVYTDQNQKFLLYLLLTDHTTYDGHNLSDVELGDGKFMPVVNIFKYLVCTI